MNVYELIFIVINFSLGYLAWYSRSGAAKKVIDLMNRFLVYSITPLTIFIGVYSQASSVILTLIILCVFHAFLIMTLTFGFTALISIGRRNLDVVYAMTISMGIPNAGFLAIPLAIVVFKTYFNIIPYTVAANIVLPITLLLLSVSLKYNNRSYLISTAPLPSLLSLAIAIVLKFMDIKVPHSVINISNAIISNISFLFFLILGYVLASLSVSDLHEYKKWLALGYLVKYIVSPVLMYILITLTMNFFYEPIDSKYVHGLLLQSVMPSALFNIAVANIFKLEVKLVSLLMVLQTLTSTVAVLTLFGFVL